jgi:hypothetical protein
VHDFSLNAFFPEYAAFAVLRSGVEIEDTVNNNLLVIKIRLNNL